MKRITAIIVVIFLFTSSFSSLFTTNADTSYQVATRNSSALERGLFTTNADTSYQWFCTENAFVPRQDGWISGYSAEGWCLNKAGGGTFAFDFVAAQPFDAIYVGNWNNKNVLYIWNIYMYDTSTENTVTNSVPLYGGAGKTNSTTNDRTIELLLDGTYGAGHYVVEISCEKTGTSGGAYILFPAIPKTESESAHDIYVSGVNVKGSAVSNNAGNYGVCACVRISSDAVLTEYAGGLDFEDFESLIKSPSTRYGLTTPGAQMVINYNGTATSADKANGFAFTASKNFDGILFPAWGNATDLNWALYEYSADLANTIANTTPLCAGTLTIKDGEFYIDFGNVYSAGKYVMAFYCKNASDMFVLVGVDGGDQSGNAVESRFQTVWGTNPSTLGIVASVHTTDKEAVNKKYPETNLNPNTSDDSLILYAAVILLFALIVKKRYFVAV